MFCFRGLYEVCWTTGELRGCGLCPVEDRRCRHCSTDICNGEATLVVAHQRGKEDELERCELAAAHIVELWKESVRESEKEREGLRKEIWAQKIVIIVVGVLCGLLGVLI